MHGTYAHLEQICKVADRHLALVLVDDSHASGLVETDGKGHSRGIWCLRSS